MAILFYCRTVTHILFIACLSRNSMVWNWQPPCPNSTYFSIGNKRKDVFILKHTGLQVFKKKLMSHLIIMYIEMTVKLFYCTFIPPNLFQKATHYIQHQSVNLNPDLCLSTLFSTSKYFGTNDEEMKTKTNTYNISLDFKEEIASKF